MASWLVKGQGGTLTLTLRNGDGDLVDADGQAVTVIVKDPTGATIVPSGAASRVSVDVYERAVTGAQAATLDRLIATWTCSIAADAKSITTEAEIVGAHLIGLAELRELGDGADNGLGNTTRYPASRLRAARQWASESFETSKAVNRAFTPRCARETLSGDGTALLILPHSDLRSVRSITVDGVTLTPSTVGIHTWGGLEAPSGTVWTVGRRNISVCYEYGLDAPPERVATAVQILAAQRVTPTDLSSRRTSETTDVGTFRFTIAGRDGAFGIPEVDQAATEYGLRKPPVGAVNR